MSSNNEPTFQQNPAPKYPDLATPTADAAELANTLQKMPMNVLFSKAALFTGKWILRPIFWWPIKYYFILLYKMIRATPRKTEAQRLIEEEEYRNSMRSRGYTI